MNETNNESAGDQNGPSNEPTNEVFITATIPCKLRWAGQFEKSEGQTSSKKPHCYQSGADWGIEIYCSRQKTAAVAEQFARLCGGSKHQLSLGHDFGVGPRELNFYATFQVLFSSFGAPYSVDFALAQGSNPRHNNWWIGSSRLIRASNLDPTFLLGDGNGGICAAIRVANTSNNRFSFEVST